MSEGTQAVDRAAVLLLAVLGAPAPIAFSDLVAASGLPKSTVSRLVSSLERNGLVQRDAHGTILPGVALTDYALSLRPEDNLAYLAQQIGRAHV